MLFYLFLMHDIRSQAGWLSGSVECRVRVELFTYFAAYMPGFLYFLLYIVNLKNKNHKLKDFHFILRYSVKREGGLN